MTAAKFSLKHINDNDLKIFREEIIQETLERFAEKEKLKQDKKISWNEDFEMISNL